MDKIKLLFFSGIIISIIIRSFFILNGSRVADIHALQEMGEVTLHNLNPYVVLPYNSYPPLAIYIEEITIKLQDFTQIPFYILIKVWSNLADLVICLLVYLFLIKAGTKKLHAVIWSLVFFLNPVSIIISAAHGQIDSIPTLLVILSAFFLMFKKKLTYTLLSGLLFGLAVSIKLNPLILLPFFLIYIIKKSRFINSLLFGLMAILPLIILILPFASGNYFYVFNRLANYTGSNDFGIPALIKGQYYIETGQTNYILEKSLINKSKYFFLVCWLILIFFFRNSEKLIKGCSITYLLFITFYFGISAQYLSWILPFAVLLKDKWVIAFSLTGIFSLLGFYMFINPKMIISGFENIPPNQGQFILMYMWSNLIFWIIGLGWLVKLSLGSIKKEHHL